MRDVIVVGLGPAGAATAAMLRDPAAFSIAGQALDVLAIEARGLQPTRMRAVALQHEARQIMSQVDDLLGTATDSRIAPEGITTIAAVEQRLRRAAAHVGVEARYDTGIAGIRDGGRAGVTVELADGTIERARLVVDATGGRLGAFHHGSEVGSTTYLTGQLPPRPSGQPTFTGTSVSVHGAGNDRTWQPVFGFNDARSGATAFVEYPSLPARAHDARAAHRLLRRHLRDAGVDPSGLREAAFIRTPHVRAPSAVDGSLIAVGDTVRRVTPRSAQGVSNGLLDARGAALAVQSTLNGPVPREQALAEYALAAGRR